MKGLKSSNLIALDGFANVCSFEELKEGEGKRLMVNDVEVAVFKVCGKIYALSNICPHQHTALIYDGFIEDEFVVCPAHGWMFNLKTGLMPTGSKGLDSYPVQIVGNQIYIKANKKELMW